MKRLLSFSVVLHTRGTDLTLTHLLLVAYGARKFDSTNFLAQRFFAFNTKPLKIIDLAPGIHRCLQPSGIQRGAMHDSHGYAFHDIIHLSLHRTLGA